MVCFIDFRVIIVDSDDDRLVVTRNDHITGIIWVPRIPQEQKLGIWLFLQILLDDLSCEDSVLHIAEGTPPQAHLLRSVFGQPKVPTAYAVTYTLEIACTLHTPAILCVSLLVLPSLGADIDLCILRKCTIFLRRQQSSTQVQGESMTR